MAEIEIEGADKQALEHQAEHGDNLTIRIAVLTVILAIVALVINHFAEELGDESRDLKLEAQMVKTEAGNQWAYFQAKSTKQSLADNVVTLSPDAAVREKYKAKVDRYEKEKSEIQTDARKLDEKSEALERQSEEVKRPEDRMKISLPLIQVGIALASITALTRVKWMLWIAMFLALVGVGFALSALYQSKHLPDHVLEWENKHGGAHRSATHEAPGDAAEAHAAK